MMGSGALWLSLLLFIPISHLTKAPGNVSDGRGTVTHWGLSPVVNRAPWMCLCVLFQDCLTSPSDLHPCSVPLNGGTPPTEQSLSVACHLLSCMSVCLSSPTWKTQGFLGHPLGPLSASSWSSLIWTLWGQSPCVWGIPCGLRSASITSLLLRFCVWMPAGQSEPSASPFPLLCPECFHQEHPHCTPALGPDSAE